jgi:hypothetical protein
MRCQTSHTASQIRGENGMESRTTNAVMECAAIDVASFTVHFVGWNHYRSAQSRGLKLLPASDRTMHINSGKPHDLRLWLQVEDHFGPLFFSYFLPSLNFFPITQWFEWCCLIAKQEKWENRNTIHHIKLCLLWPLTYQLPKLKLHIDQMDPSEIKLICTNQYLFPKEIVP